MTTKPAAVPAFANEAEERAFWDSHDSADYLDLAKAERARFRKLEATTKSISPQGHQGRNRKGERTRDAQR